MDKNCGDCEHLTCNSACLKNSGTKEFCDGFCEHKQEDKPCDWHICDYFKKMK